MTEPSHPLNRPLPPDVAAGESAFIQFYQKYTVFSWPWAWRRTVVFGALGVLAGVSFGASHGLFVKDVWQAITVSLACSAANLALVGAGPVMGACFRHLGFSRRVQSALIVAAVIAGVFLGAWTGDLASQYHDDLMAAHGAHSSPKMQPNSDVHMFVARALDVSRDLLILFICSGGLALPA
jgi:hypothetical protein